MANHEPTKESEIQNPQERAEVHEAAHSLGEIRKQQMAQGDIFTHENPSNPSEPPAGEERKIEERHQR